MLRYPKEDKTEITGFAIALHKQGLNWADITDALFNKGYRNPIGEVITIATIRSWLMLEGLENNKGKKKNKKTTKPVEEIEDVKEDDDTGYLTEDDEELDFLLHILGSDLANWVKKNLIRDKVLNWKDGE